jgi:hypothetical protein
MTTTVALILVLLYGIGGAACLVLGMIIGANSRMREERHEMDADDPYLARTRVYQGNDSKEI